MIQYMVIRVEFPAGDRFRKASMTKRGSKININKRISNN